MNYVEYNSQVERVAFDITMNIYNDDMTNDLLDHVVRAVTDHPFIAEQDNHKHVINNTRYPLHGVFMEDPKELLSCFTHSEEGVSIGADSLMRQLAFEAMFFEVRLRLLPQIKNIKTALADEARYWLKYDSEVEHYEEFKHE